MTAKRHPIFSAEAARRRIQDHADLQAANAWLAAELAAMTEAKWRARRDAALTFGVWTLCAAVWVALIVIAVDVLS